MASQVSKAAAILERVAGYRFREDSRLLEALDTTGLRVTQSNQRLALLGDAVLKHALLDDWYATGTPKGAGNTLVSTIGSNSNLAAVAINIGLDACIITHPGHVGRVSNGMLSTTVEAVLGAIYLDCEKNMNTIKSVMAALHLNAVSSS